MKKKNIFIIFETKIEIIYTDGLLYKARLNRIFSDFKDKSAIKYRKIVKLQVGCNKIIINKEGKSLVLTDVMMTDIYPIAFSVIYDAAKEKNFCGIHASAVKKGKKVFLICGGFGVGKSTLALAFERRGWKILSTDQTIISEKNGQIQIIRGSKYMKFNDNVYWTKSIEQKPYEVSGVLLVYGLAKEGRTDICKIKNGIPRLLWERCVWPWNTLICRYGLTNIYEKENNLQHIIAKLNNVQTLTYSIRGDAEMIVNILEEEEKNDKESL